MSLCVFDLDGTLIEGYMRDNGMEAWPYMRVAVLPNVLHKLELLACGGVTFAIATNQAGVAYGYQTEQETYDKLALAVERLQFFYGAPFSVHICMHHPGATDDRAKWRDPVGVARRKPAPGMLKEAMSGHGVRQRDTTFIGDMESDRECAHAAGVNFRWAADFFA